MNCYQIIKSYIDNNQYNECFDLFNNPENHKLIQMKRIPHIMITESLRIAAKNNNIPLTKLLISYISQYKLKYFMKYTEIFSHACIEGKLNIVKLFLDNSSIIYPSFMMNIPLGVAIYKDQVKIVKLLLKNKSVINKIRSSMLSAFYKKNNAYNYFVQKVATMINKGIIRPMRNEDVLIKLLKDNNIKLAKIILDTGFIHNIDVGCESLIRLAMHNNNLDIVKILLTYEPIMNINDCGFFNACFKGHYTIIQYIMETNSLKINDITSLIKLCDIIFPSLFRNQNIAKVINILVNYDIINHNIADHCLGYIAPHITGLGLLAIPWKQPNITAHPRSDHLLDKLLNRYCNKCIIKNGIWCNSINELLQNPKLNKCYPSSILLLLNKTELFHNFGVPNDIINRIVTDMYTLLLYEYIL